MDRGDRDRRGQARQRVNDELRRAGRAGGEQDPFGLALVDVDCLGGRKRKVAGDPPRRAPLARAGRVAIGHDRVHTGFLDDRGHVLGRDVRRADDDASRHAV